MPLPWYSTEILNLTINPILPLQKKKSIIQALGLSQPAIIILIYLELWQETKTEQKLH